MRDSSVAPTVQTIMIRDADELTPHNMFRTIPVNTGRSPFASRPKDVAQAIASCGATAD
jgi:hypothetical protein